MEANSPKPRRAKIARAMGIIALAIVIAALALYAGPLYRHYGAPAVKIALNSTFPGCGGVMIMKPEATQAGRGAQIHFVNEMDEMPVQLYVTSDPEHRNLLFKSPWLSPGQSWDYTFWESGNFYLTNNPDDGGFLAGLKGKVQVKF